MTDRREKPEQSTKEWCAGLPLVLRRPLNDGEREDLRCEAAVLRRRGYGVIVLFAAAVALFATAATHTDISLDAVQTGLAVAAILLTAVGLPVTILLTRDAFRRSKGISRDLAAGTVKQFAGRLGSEPVDDETLRLLRRARLIPAEADAEWSLEVLASSGRVWRVSGRSVKLWIVTHTVEVAETPPFAAIAAQWLQPVKTQPWATLLAGRRELSQAEQAELHRYARRLWLRPLPSAVGMTLWFCIPIAVILLKGSLQSQGDWGRFVFMAMITLINYFWLITAIRQSRQLQQDERAGYVVIVREDQVVPPPTAAEEAAEEQDESEVIEILPVSRRRWTASGRPAVWRIVRP